MPKFRKKPVVIEAIPVRDVLEAYREGMAAWRANLPVWFQEAFDRDLVHLWTDGVLIRTLEGQMEACGEDWIIRGVKGEIYPCKPAIFEATYEPADA